MRWNNILKEFFLREREGTIEEIKNWIWKNYSFELECDVKNYRIEVENKFPKMKEINDSFPLRKSAYKKLRRVALNQNMRKFIKEGFIIREEAKTGIGRYKYKINSQSNDAENTVKEKLQWNK